MTGVSGACHLCGAETTERFGGMFLCAECEPDEDDDSGDERPASAACETPEKETPDGSDDDPRTANVDSDDEGGPDAPAREAGTDEGDDSGGAGETPTFRELYEQAAEQADRATWEYVEEAAVRDALDAAGFAHLLDSRALHGVDGWRFADLSGDDEPADPRWYYASGDEPRPDEFRRFDELLRAEAPDDYVPHYFRVAPAGKDPATQFGGWKRDEARLDVDEAVEWMETGGNVGIAGRGECKICEGDGVVDREPCDRCDGTGDLDGEACDRCDGVGAHSGDRCDRCDGTGDLDGPLVNVDIDDDEATTPDDVPTSLRARSRSRTGWHTWYFDPEGEIPNIPTDDYGEVRAAWQYVVAPGSFVASAREELPDDADDPGYYTVEAAEPVARIGFDDLPEVFHDAAEADDDDHDDQADGGDRGPSAVDDASDGTRADDSGDADHDGASAVFDVEATDLITGAHDPSDRFTSIFHDSDTGANMSVSDDKLHCWRHNVAHGGLQALATLSTDCTYGCGDLGASHKNGGAGSNRLKGKWQLVWYAWREAKSRGLIPDDDPVPWRALVGVAVDDGVVDDDDLVEREGDGSGTYTGFPDAATYDQALDHVREEHGVEPGRTASGGSDAEPAVATPLARVDALDHDEARRYARKREEWPTTREARQKLRDRILETIRHGDQKVIDAPTALGKSHTVATEPWLDHADTTGEAPVVMFHETREARDQAVEASREANVRAARLLGRSEACACAAGDHDPAQGDDDPDPDVVVTVDGEPASEWIRRVCDERGLPLSVAHKMLAERCDQDHDQLPCEGPVDLAADQDGGRCQSVAQWDDVPRDGEGDVRHDVIHATHQFAHVPSLRNGTNMVFDERPDFGASLSHDRIRRMVGAYLDDAGAPVTDFERFVARARTPRDERSPNEHAEHGYVSDALDHEPDREWYVDAPDAHTLAPAVTRAIWYALDDAEADANGRYTATVPHDPPRLDEDASDEAGWNREYLSVVLDDQHNIRTLRVAPDTGNARSVVGLDAHPTLHLWQRNVHPDIRPRPVLDPTKRARWRRYERGLVVAQVGDATRPLTSGEYFDEDGTRAFLDALRDQFGERWSTAITAGSVEQRTADLMEAVGVDDPDTLHYGEEKSRNDFGDQDVGAVLGCIDPGDDYVLDLLAEAGLDAEPETTDEGDRAHGRGFVGPDADAAAALLASVRENHVAQAAGRYARNADDPEDRAVVFVRTDATPPAFVDVEVPGVEYVGTDDQRAIVDALRERPTATAGELAEAADVTERYVRDLLARLADAGTVEVREGAGEHGANVYRALAGLGGPEQVDLTPETRNDDVWNSYTFAFRIDPATTARTASVTADDRVPTGETTATADARGADPPE